MPRREGVRVSDTINAAPLALRAGAAQQELYSKHKHRQDGKRECQQDSGSTDRPPGKKPYQDQSNQPIPRITTVPDQRDQLMREPIFPLQNQARREFFIHFLDMIEQLQAVLLSG